MVKILAAVGAVLALVLIHAATKPDTFRVQRATSIHAPPEKIFSLIDDFGRWGSWSPYEKKDLAMKRSFSDPTRGKGAVYEWDGNKEVGQGRMEITDSSPSTRVAINLDFTRPFEAHNRVEFTLEPREGATHVTWAMHGPSPYISKLIGIFFNMDSMVGKDFEAGLANLKSVAEQ